MRSESHKHVTSIWNGEKLPEGCKESIMVPIYTKADKADCSNIRDIPLLTTAYKILFNILLSRLTPYGEQIIGDHQCGFGCNRSTADHIFCIREMLDTKWEYNDAVHQIFIEFKTACDSVRREVLYNILIQFGIPTRMLRLIKMCLTETQSRDRIGNHLSDMFSIKSGLKQGDALSPLLLNFPLEYAIRGVR